MENKEKKNNKHTNKDKEKSEKCFCQECKDFLSNKCAKKLSIICDNNENNYNINNINEEKEIENSICKEKKHTNELKFFCKTHNVLCCVGCISKIKTNEYGQHTDCDICIIEDIEKEKKKLLMKNLKMLENIFPTIQQSIDEIKMIYKNIKKNKEEIKANIKTVFSNIRKVLNDREEELLLNVDLKFNDIYFNEDLIKENENIIEQIKINYGKGKLVENSWKNYEITSAINDCLIIENDLETINQINGTIKKYKSSNIEILFSPEPDDEIVNKIIEEIKTLEKKYEE
jgi:hypothetical protein